MPLTFTLSLYSLLLFSSTTTAAAQPYNATDHYLFDCGSSSTTNFSARIWDGDESSNFVPSSITTTSFSSAPLYRDPSVPETPYSTARIFNTSSFTYKFPVSQGPKFLRLYFYPATYSDLNPNQSYFSVSCNGYSLLSNFSAFLTASFLAKTRSDAGVDGPQVPNFVKEFIIYVKDTRILNVTFTPTPNSFAFINGIEIVSMPENLYFNSSNLNYVGQTTGPVIDNKKALENIYRLNMGGGHISGTEDTGMYRSWEQDNRYIYGAAIGWTPVYAQLKPITYTMETPNYTAPELVYQTQRSMGNLADRYNLTWLLSVDSGFYYKLRLHFCNIIPQYTERGQVVFKIFINNQTADDEIDLFHLTQGSGYPVYKDYIVFVDDTDRSGGKQDMWVAIHPSPNTETYHDAYLNGLEAFKVSADRSLSSLNPELSEYPQPRPASPVIPNKKKTVPYGAIIGGVGGGLVLLIVLGLVVFLRTRVKHFGKAGDKPTKSTKTCQPPLLSDRCRRFSLIEVKIATCEFDEKCIIGKGGFGTVYKGCIDNTKTVVAIKRLKSSSKQGFNEFRTEIGFLSKLRHVQLVSLIGYCDDEGEMILVYDYMPNGTLRDHLYKTNNPPLSWKRRLDIQWRI